MKRSKHKENYKSNAKICIQSVVLFCAAIVLLTAQAQAATITSPTQGQTLTSTTLTIEWEAVQGAENYSVRVGTFENGRDIFFRSLIQGTSFTVEGLPQDGTALHLSVWQNVDGWRSGTAQVIAWDGVAPPEPEPEVDFSELTAAIEQSNLLAESTNTHLHWIQIILFGIGMFTIMCIGWGIGARLA